MSPDGGRAVLARGEVPEWPKGADCKSAGLCLRRFESFPLHHGVKRERARSWAGIAQLVEHQPSKLRVAGSSPVSRSTGGVRTAEDRRHQRAHVAQSVEHFLGKEEVTGSNPVMGSSATAHERYDTPRGDRTGMTRKE